MRDPRRLTKLYESGTVYHLRTANLSTISERRALFALAARVQSPLESLLGVRLIEEFSRRGVRCVDPRPPIVAPSERPNSVTFCCNFSIDRYRFDFWIQADVHVSGSYYSRTVVVECDGVAWHWGRQLDLDRRKDELSEELGWTMFRVPSKRILKDPSSCAGEIVTYVLDGSMTVPGLLMTQEEFKAHCSET